MHREHTTLCCLIVALLLATAPALAEDVDPTTKAMELEQKANKYAKAGNYKKALSLYMDSLSYNPKNGNALFNASSIATALKDSKKASLLLTSFIAVEPAGPDTPSMQAKLDKIMKSLGKYSGTVKVTLEPENAQVLIDGLYMGTAPIEELQIPAGSYDLKATYVDYHDFSKELKVEANEETIVAEKMKKIIFYGTFILKCQPKDGVKVFADGVQVATTPMEKPIELEADRKVFIELKKPGYDKWIRNVILMRNELYTLNATLEASATKETGTDTTE